MPTFTGAGSLWHMDTGTFVATNVSGDAAGLIAAKLITGGVIQIGPGMEGVALGTFGPTQAIIRILNTGGYGVSRFQILDGTDPTKIFFMDPAAITTATTRTATIPNWSGFFLLPATLGTAGEFLRSGGAGVQPTWASVTVSKALLDGANHTDTVAQAVTRGSLIYGNATPKWDEMTIGASGTVLYSNGTDPSWTAISTLQSHDLLPHIQPFSAANCNWTGAVTTITTSGNAFANVKVGDFVYVGTGFATSGNQGKRVAVWNNANSIDVDTAKSGSDLVNGTIWFVPGDHWNDTANPDSTGTGMGYMLASGRGSYTRTGGTTFQELRGPIRWLGHANGSISTDFRVQGSTSAAGGAYFGFSIWKSTTAGVYFMVNNITADRVLTVPDATGDIILNSAVQTISSKTFDLGNSIQMDGTATYTTFRNAANQDRLAYDLTAPTALRAVAYKDYGGTAVVATGEGTSGQILTSNGAGAAPSYQTAALPVTAVCSSQHTNATTTCTEVTDLSKTLVAGTYRFSYWLICQTVTSTVGIHFAINYTGTATKIVYHAQYISTGTGVTGNCDDTCFGSGGQAAEGSASRAEGTTTATVGTYGFGAINVDTLIRIDGVVVVSDGGDLELWHGSDSAVQTSVEIGSNLMLMRVA